MKHSNIRAQVILTREEYDVLQQKAEALGLSFSAYVRAVLRTTDFPLPINHPTEPTLQKDRGAS